MNAQFVRPGNFQKIHRTHVNQAEFSFRQNIKQKLHVNVYFKNYKMKNIFILANRTKELSIEKNQLVL